MNLLLKKALFELPVMERALAEAPELLDHILNTIAPPLTNSNRDPHAHLPSFEPMVALCEKHKEAGRHADIIGDALLRMLRHYPDDPVALSLFDRFMSAVDADALPKTTAQNWLVEACKHVRSEHVVNRLVAIGANPAKITGNSENVGIYTERTPIAQALANDNVEAFRALFPYLDHAVLGGSIESGRVKKLVGTVRNCVAARGRGQGGMTPLTLLDFACVYVKWSRTAREAVASLPMTPVQRMQALRQHLDYPVQSATEDFWNAGVVDFLLHGSDEGRQGNLKFRDRQVLKPVLAQALQRLCTPVVDHFVKTQPEVTMELLKDMAVEKPAFFGAGATGHHKEPLHYMVSNYRFVNGPMQMQATEMIRVLIAAGLGVEAVGESEKESPLSTATRLNIPPMAALLIELGADLHRPGQYGSSPMEHAKACRHEEILAIMHAKEARNIIAGVAGQAESRP